MQKIGRPKPEDPKNKRVSLRVNEEDYQKIRKYATDQKLTIAQLLQQSLTAYMVSDGTLWEVLTAL